MPYVVTTIKRGAFGNNDPRALFKRYAYGEPTIAMSGERQEGLYLVILADWENGDDRDTRHASDTVERLWSGMFPAEAFLDSDDAVRHYLDTLNRLDV